MEHKTLERIFDEQGFKVNHSDKSIYQIKYTNSKTKKYCITLNLVNKECPELEFVVRDFSYIEKAFENLIKLYPFVFGEHFTLMKTENFALAKREISYDKKMNRISYYTEWVYYYNYGKPDYSKDKFTIEASPYELKAKLYGPIDFLHKAKLLIRVVNILRLRKLPSFKIDEDHKKSIMDIRYKPGRKIGIDYFSPNIKKFIIDDLGFDKYFNNRLDITINIGTRNYIHFTKGIQQIELYLRYVSSIRNISNIGKALYEVSKIRSKDKLYDKNSLRMSESHFTRFSKEFVIQNLIGEIRFVWLGEGDKGIVRLEAKKYNYKSDQYEISFYSSCIADFKHCIKFSLKALEIFSKSLPNIDYFFVTKKYDKGILEVYSNKAKWQKEIEELPNIRNFVIRSFYDVIKNK